MTVVLGVKDNVKKMAKSDDLGKLQYLGLPLDRVLTLLDVKQVRFKRQITVLYLHLTQPTP